MNQPDIDIATLTPEERLSLLEQLWDSLTVTPGAIPLTEAQRAELDRRLDDLEIEGPVGIPWDEVFGPDSQPQSVKRVAVATSHVMANHTFDRTAGSPALAAAGQRERWPATAVTREERDGRRADPAS